MNQQMTIKQTREIIDESNKRETIMKPKYQIHIIDNNGNGREFGDYDNLADAIDDFLITDKDEIMHEFQIDESNVYPKGSTIEKSLYMLVDEQGQEFNPAGLLMIESFNL